MAGRRLKMWQGLYMYTLLRESRRVMMVVPRTWLGGDGKCGENVMMYIVVEH
jgi:hypothetical protein